MYLATLAEIIDEVGYLPLDKSGANLFFLLVNARYEKGAMILTSNRSFQEWGEIFGDTVVAAALLDRLLILHTTLSRSRLNWGKIRHAF